MSEEKLNWSPENMLEVTLKQPDDFLKIRKPYLVLVLQVEKTKRYFNLATFYINKANIILYISKSYLL